MKKVLIVGASSGIGYACAKKFLAEKYAVLNLSRTECVLAGVKNYLCDVSDEQALDKSLTTILIENPAIDVLVYSAGFSMACPLETVSPADYRYLFEVNFFGFVHCLRRLVPALRHQEGTACVIGSLASFAPIPFDCYYTAAKSALNALCAALQTELQPKGVRVICILPGGTKTNFTFKRKICPPEAAGDYALELDTATKKLAETEQNGQTAEEVAKTVYHKCTVKCCSYLFTPGLKNRLTKALLRLLPQWALTYLTRNFYLQPGED